MRRRLAVLVAGAAIFGTGVALADGGKAVTTPSGCGYSPRHTSVRRGHSYAPRVALTFDDGPSAAAPALLKALEDKRAPATFFVLGGHVRGHEALLRRMLADGDAIGNHSFSHANLATRSPRALAQELDRTQRAIARATGFTPCLMRPPYGIDAPAVLAALGRRHLTSVLWSVNSADYTRPGAAAIKRNVLAGAGPGTIVLAHDEDGARGRALLRALPSIIDTLRQRGYELVTVTDLLGLAQTPAAPVRPTAGPSGQDGSRR
ncbi:MAG: Polysaccharide deacetylase [Solirubrobacterales bacterium]|nr:Polysaccharide deacetylase [Solirubrobacterales bacterium]